MSWHFSRALAEVYSEGISLDGEPYAPSKLKTTVVGFSCKDKTTEFSNLSRYGTTCEPLTEDHGEELSTWFREAFPARTSRAPEKEPDSKEPDPDFGLKWRELSVKFDLVSCSWKTYRCLFQEDLTSSSLILPKWGLMLNGVLYRRATSERPINGIGSGLWPTPTARDHKDGSAKSCQNVPVNGLLGRAVHRWSTPTQSDATGGPGKSEKRTGGDNLRTQAGGQLNPTWVEWLMGFPSEWTDLRPLETRKFQKWRRLHGKF